MAKSSKKTTSKKTAKKKASKKTAKKTDAKKSSKKTAKKAATKKTAQKSSSKTTKKAAKKSDSKATKKETKKSAAKSSSGGSAKAKGKSAKTKTPPKGGVTVQIGGSAPAFSVAPGARISGRKANTAPARNCNHGEEERKLTKKELNQIRDILIDRRDEILHGMRRELADYRNRATNRPLDEADKAADAYDEDLSFEIASRNDEELEEIEAALDKIDKGTYGQCEACDSSIAPSRLKILPYATRCAGCRSLEERSRREDGTVAWNLLSDGTNEDGD